MAGSPRESDVSGARTTFLLLLSMGVSALLIPTVFHLPSIVEWQMVIGVWWLSWAVAVTWLLFRGGRLSDDYQMHYPRVWFLGRFLQRSSAPAVPPSDSRFMWGYAMNDLTGC